MKVKNILTGGLASLCVFITSCGAAMNRNTTEFEWHATESAPAHYPMEIIRGTFFYKGENQGLYIPSGGTLNAGWGISNSVHVTGPEKKPLPDRVDVLFYSYTEKQFYHGKFDLPYEQILELFRDGYKENPNKPYYSAVMVGVAPGGAVSVWLEGYRTKEIFFGQAEKVNIDPGAGFNLPFDSKAESDAYIEKQLVNVLKPQELESLKKNGVPFGTWARYRKLYNWAPTYKDGRFSTDKKMPIDYLNGEHDWIPTIFNEEIANTPLPLPRKLQFSVTFGDESFLYIVHFDDFELMDAAEKLGSHNEKIYIEFDPKVPRPTTRIRVHNDKESIELKKITVEDW